MPNHIINTYTLSISIIFSYENIHCFSDSFTQPIRFRKETPLCVAGFVRNYGIFNGGENTDRQTNCVVLD